MRTIALGLIGITLSISMVYGQGKLTISSPDGQLTVAVELKDGKPFYSIQKSGKDVILPSTLGLIRNDGSFADGLTFEYASDVMVVKDSYTMMAGKRKNCAYEGNERIFRYKNTEGEFLDIIFRVSNDGAAFSYAFLASRRTQQPLSCSIKAEKTTFTFPEKSLSWLHPMPVSKSGWSRTQSSYEEYYENGKPVGFASPMGQGWCMPALFKTPDDIWILVCDSDVDENYCAVHLGHDSKNGIYEVALAQPEEHRGPIDPAEPQITFPFQSPWRVLMIGSLGTIVESTLMTDVASPSKIADASFVHPGKAAWHWLQYGDDSSTLEWADKYLDFAVKMKWQYMLIDANWDRNIGYEKMAEFVKKANAKGVDVILWYNSNGDWNDAPMGPKNRMHTHEVRLEEFAKLKQMGVKGVKVDFFGGDKQATMKLYLDTFKDAADYGIVVNCHGSTIPRGWQRTWPNLVTMEAVRGMEYCSFEQPNANRQPQHCAVLPFTRNAIGSMDFTPMVFKPKLRGSTLRTTPAFELALAVIFESGIQHFGLAPDEYDLMAPHVVEFLQNVPTAWDDTKFIDGYPGQFVVLARKAGTKWYIAGINAADQPKQIKLDLSKFAGAAKGLLITDADNHTLQSKPIENASAIDVTLIKSGGFVLVLE
ncbi:MAG: glycoside hydrolase family 97 protein [Planctomycetaceae bacterium]|nr:glycoside hydrolase family 97 protein [Planctomycetaceae bacterium]